VSPLRVVRGPVAEVLLIKLSMHVEISFICEKDFGVKVGVLLKLCNCPFTKLNAAVMVIL
jgi:hypothetical protein